MDQYEKRKRDYCLNGVELTADAIKKACVKLVTVNGRPFTLMNNNGFRDPIVPLIAGFLKGDLITVTTDTVQKLVQGIADELREIIKEEIKVGEMISPTAFVLTL